MNGLSGPGRHGCNVFGRSGADADPRRQVWPLYAAGFTTAFGAHGIAANLGGFTTDVHASLLVLGALLAVYDGAEVLLKPVFGTLADRIGTRPVLLGGLAVFAVASLGFVLAHDTTWLWVARFGQGVGASAFSPAASAMVAQLHPAASRGRAFGSYGFYKSIGYTAGPLLGGGIVALGGLTALFAVMTGLAVAVALWVRLAVPRLTPTPRKRQTLLDTARRLTDPGFLRPTAALSAATAALSAGVGFLPVTGAAAGLGPLATGAAVSLLAATAAVVQPLAGRALDAGRIGESVGVRVGLAVTAIGLAAAALPGIAGPLTAAVLIGVGTGLITPVAFATLAGHADPEHLGQTMGAAELGRECGDAGGPLLVAAVATTAALPVGYLVLAAAVAGTGAAIGTRSTGAAAAD